MNHHHKLLEEMGHLKDREQVLIGENDQLRAQLVERTEEENKKFGDLMVQYNMKREDRENGGLDKQGTSNNQVTVKTEWDHEEVKVEIKDEDEDDYNIFIKREFVPAYIKTESSDVKIEIKEEIKEEEDHKDDCGFDLRLVKKEEVSDDDDNSMQLNHPLNEVVQSNLNQPMDTSSRDQLHTPTNSAPSPNEPMQLTNSSVTEQSDDQQVMAANDDQLAQSTRVVQSSDAQAIMDRVMSHENGLAGEDEDDEDMGGDDELSNIPNDNHDGSVVASNEPSTSARARSNRVTSKQSTASTARKLNKRKQSQPNRTGKRSKKSVEVNDDGDEEDIGHDHEDRGESKVKVLLLNCFQSSCNVKLDSMDHLHNHLSTVHQLSPFQCFAANCNVRFDEPRQVSAHIQLNHSRSTRFLCSVCSKKCGSQHKTYVHWYQNHQTGQFQCNLVTDCVQVTDTRGKMRTHQLTKHQPNHFHCTHPGCTASFSCNSRLKQHQLTHLNTNQFLCNWPHCSIQFKLRGNLVTHIRTQHFGLPRSMKAQKEKNIVDLRDPNEYVRVVVDE